MEKFSVLMSVYKNEKPKYMIECFESLRQQTVQASEWVIVEDGPLTDDLYSVLDEYQNKYPGLIKRFPLESNVGLGLALRYGVPKCSYELIARMDTDDICREDRFEKQLLYMEQNPKVDVCGSHIKEFYENISDIKSIRIVPLNDEEIKHYQKRRDGVNHVTVMFKKSAVMKAGNYQSCLLMEDTLLWINMILSGAVFGNIDDYLVYVRTGKDMFSRRGGLSYFKKYMAGRKRIYETGYISWWDYFYTLIVQFTVCIMPNAMRKIVFEKMLRNNV